MHARSTILLLALVTPALTGCIAGDAEGDDGLPTITDGPFTVGNFVQELEHATGASLVNARVESLQVEYNQTRVTLVEWRSFTQHGTDCELVSTMVYEGQGRNGGFLVHNEGEPCPLSLYGRASVAEVVALVDRVPLGMVQDQVLGGVPVFSISLAGYCAYEAAEGGEQLHVWNGAGVTARNGQIACGGGTNSALTLAVTEASELPGQSAKQTYVILEQVPAR